MTDMTTRPTLPPPGAHPATGGSLGALVVSNIIGGIGVASGIAVGALLIGQLWGNEYAGVGQGLTVLGAGVAAVPLAHLAARRGRRVSLRLGYLIALAGAALIVAGATLGWLPVVLLGLAAFGFASATNLQSRYAAAELAGPHSRGRTLSFVVWATTLGSVIGPNLTSLAAGLGPRIGVEPLAAPYLFSAIGFGLAALAVTLLYRAPATLTTSAPVGSLHPAAARGGSFAALGWALRHPLARFGVVLLVVSHAVMVAIMTMTPLHLSAGEHNLVLIGGIVSLHILGMYALSPLFGWTSDQFGPLRTGVAGLIILAAAVVLAMLAGHDAVWVGASLVLLGVGWSAATIAASSLLAGVDAGELRVPLQGATDALMNYAGAFAALASAPLLAWFGFGGLSLVAGLLLVPGAVLGWGAHRWMRSTAPVR